MAAKPDAPSRCPIFDFSAPDQQRRAPHSVAENVVHACEFSEVTRYGARRVHLDVIEIGAQKPCLVERGGVEAALTSLVRDGEMSLA